MLFYPIDYEIIGHWFCRRKNSEYLNEKVELPKAFRP